MVAEGPEIFEVRSRTRTPSSTFYYRARGAGFRGRLSTEDAFDRGDHDTESGMHQQTVVDPMASKSND
jgi:hypothetical protein